MNPTTIKDFLTPMVELGSAVAGLATAIVGITKYFNYRSRQDELRLVKQTFDTVVMSLRSDNLIERMSGAILLRRFYDSKTEMGTGGAPYWKVAVDVSAAILRGLTTDDFQKLLADGLAFAPTLIRADLQRTNLQFAYLGVRQIGATKEITTDLRNADFYRADLSRASLKKANAEGAVFYQARLHNTVLSGANLTGANFFDVDIKGAILNGAILYKANFNNTRNIPVEFGNKLDEKGICQDQKPFQRAPAASDHAQIEVFVSKPGCLNTPQKQQIDFVETKLQSQGVIPKTVEREDYQSFGAIGEVRRVMSGCVGAIV